MKKHTPHSVNAIYYRPIDSWVGATAVQKAGWDRITNTHRISRQRAGYCCIPRTYVYQCDTHCETCRYATTPPDAPQPLSIDKEAERVINGESSYACFLSDFALSTTIDDKRIILRDILSTLRRTAPADYLLLMFFASGLPERDSQRVLGLPRTTYIYRRDKLIARLRQQYSDPDV